MDLFKELLPLLKSGKFEDILKISDADMKKISPLIALKLMSSVKGKHAADALIINNEFINEGFYEMSDHPKLQLMMLMAMRTSGRNYYPGNYKKDPFATQIQKFFPHWKADEVKMYMDISTKEELLELGMDRGLQSKEMKAWKKIVTERK